MPAERRLIVPYSIVHKHFTVVTMGLNIWDKTKKLEIVAVLLQLQILSQMFLDDMLRLLTKVFQSHDLIPMHLA